MEVGWALDPEPAGGGDGPDPVPELEPVGGGNVPELGVEPAGTDDEPDSLSGDGAELRLSPSSCGIHAKYCGPDGAEACCDEEVLFALFADDAPDLEVEPDCADPDCADPDCVGPDCAVPTVAVLDGPAPNRTVPA